MNIFFKWTWISGIKWRFSQLKIIHFWQKSRLLSDSQLLSLFLTTVS